MADDAKTHVIRKVCRKCGLVHEAAEPVRAGDEWKLIGLAATGIALLAFLWFFVFKYGVPLVTKIKNLD